MKINKLLFAMFAGAMLASCSDNPSDEPAPDNNAVGSKGYIGITIGMPSNGMSRGNNDVFNDGLETEYGVTNAVLIFFQGEEANPTFYKAYSLSSGEWNTVNDNPNQITQNRVVTFPVDFAKESTGDLWVLAVINPNGIVSAQGDRSLKVNGVDFTGTFKDFLALQTNVSLSDPNKFLMTNSPYSSKPGTIPNGGTKPSNAKFRTLSLVNKDRICATQQAALDLPAAAIFVERAVAKVEVNATNLDIADGAINFPTGDYSIDGNSIDWALDNKEPSTFIVRNLDFDTDNSKVPTWAYYDTNTTQPLNYHYRFLGNAGFGHTYWPNTPDTEEHYRTYFGIDPHGVGISEEDMAEGVGPMVAAKTADFTNPGSDHPQYCYENTFDVAHMDYRNTTRAIIKVNFGGDGSGNLYTVGEDKKNVYVYENAASYLTFAVLNHENVINAWTDYFDGKGETYHNQATTEGMNYNRTDRTASNDWMTVKIVPNYSTGRLVVTDITLHDGAGNDVALTPEALALTMEDVNNNVTVKCYKDGVAYYAVRIRHFGNDLAPWTAPENTTLTTVAAYGKDGGYTSITDQDTQNYLGRYGVLRNNWYVLKLGNINQMGEPVIGDLPLDGTPDDSVLKEESISCRINILSWAKRNQSDDL